MKRTISAMRGSGSLNHNRRSFTAENVDPERSSLNVVYRDEPIQKVYHELFDEAVNRYNAKQKRKDRCINDYYEHLRTGKQEKLFHELIVQIGNKDDMGVLTENGALAKELLDEYMQGFQERNPTLRVFGAFLHMDEATPHLHIDFVPYVSGWKGKGLDTKVSLKQALKALGFAGGSTAAMVNAAIASSVSVRRSVIAVTPRLEPHGKAHAATLGISPGHECGLAVFLFARDQKARRKPQPGPHRNIVPVVLVRLHTRHANE